MTRRSVVDYLENLLRRGGECAYVQHRGYRTVRWSYRQVAEAAFQCARELQERAIGKGDRVLLWGPNSAEWVVAFFGCALRSTIVIPIDDAGVADFAQRVYQQVGGSLLLSSRQHARSSSSVLSAAASTPVMILEDLRETLSGHSSAPYDAVGICAADTLEVVFTSGTTAEPKGVVISHGNILGNIAPLETEIQRYLKYERLVHPVRFLNLLPLSHVFGQFMGIFVPQLLGGATFFQESLSPTQIIDTVKRERISVVITVPRILDALRERVERDYEARGELERFRKSLASGAGRHFVRCWWKFRHVHH